MTSSINDTIVSAVPVAREGQYRQYVEAAVRALTDRERDLAASCLDFAADQGAPRTRVAEFLAQIGMAIPNGPRSVTSQPSQPTSGRDVDLESLERATSTMAEATRAMLVAVQALRNQSS